MHRNSKKSIFLAPYSDGAATKNFTQTVLGQVPISDIEDLSDETFTDEAVSVWGTRENIKNRWEKISTGDVVLFYQHKKYRYYAEVISTEHNRSLGKRLWQNYEADDPWEYLIYLQNLQEIEVPHSEFNELIGYSTDFVPRGSQNISDSRLSTIRGRFGSVDQFIQELTTDTGTPTIDVHAEFEAPIHQSVFSNLYFHGSTAVSLARDISAALQSGKHIIFTGPPGTGKTEVAQAVCKFAADRAKSPFTDYQITTATADWSTFDTVGGYMPDEEQSGALEFKPGQVLRRFKDGNQQVNELLVIDEINRADIDKAFGQLFTLLSGQGVQLPFERDGQEIEIIPANEYTDDPDQLKSYQFVVPNSWRIIATMNSYDKTSLYEMSYAFMRRFAFIRIEVPEIPKSDSGKIDLMSEYIDVWSVDSDEDVVLSVANVWRAVNKNGRKIGPALVKDILEFIEANGTGTVKETLSRAIVSYLFPQLEGVVDRDEIVAAVASLDDVDGDYIWEAAEAMLQVKPRPKSQ